jgi:hypothetical protein
VDTEIEELKDLIRNNTKLIEDTNRMVHKMHRAAVWSRVFTFIWWGTLLVLTGSIYYYFLLPYIDQFSAFAVQGEEYWKQFQTFFNR